MRSRLDEILNSLSAKTLLAARAGHAATKAVKTATVKAIAGANVLLGGIRTV